MSDEIKIEQALSDLGITMECEFVPQSKSRNAKKEYSKITDFCINWKVTISKNGRVVFDKQDYMQGIGHLPAGLGDLYRITLDYWNAVQFVCEEGKYNPLWKKYNHPSMRITSLPAPSIADVLWCFLMDTYAWDCNGFSDWCAEFGYDDDSMKAKKIYDKCMEIAILFHKNFSDDEIEVLDQLFEDY